jgi:carboxyl-terminal processing protease
MRRTGGIAGVALLLVGAFTLGLSVTRAHDGSAVSLAPAFRDDRPQVIDQVRAELASGYYRPVPTSILERGSVDAIIAGLDDPHTSVLAASEYEALRARTAESYSGVGLTVGSARDALVVKEALRGPARAAGIKPGDRIVMVDGRKVRRLPFDRSLDLIKGEEGTTVRLTVRRPREGRLDFTVERREMQLPAVRSRTLRGHGPKLGYVRVLSFRAGEAEEVAQRGRSLVDEGAKGLVLDLRDNPGGLLSQAVDTVSLFVEAGVVCVADGVNHGRHVYETTGDAPLADVPLVVLVDRETASAAEVVAAALADHERAPLVGRRTYGKASVQSVRELANGAALKLTTAVFLTPAGTNLAEQGIKPDVKAADRPRTPLDEALAKAKQALRAQL